MHLDEILRMRPRGFKEPARIGDVWTRAVPTLSTKGLLTRFANTRKTGGDGVAYPVFSASQVMPSAKVFGKTKKTIVIENKRYVIPDDVELVDSAKNATNNTNIDTGIKAVDNMEMFIRFKAITGSLYIFQARQNTTATIYGISGSQTRNTITAFGINSGITRTAGNIYTVKVTVVNRAVTLYVKDETTGEEDTKTGTASASAYSFPSPTTIKLFGDASKVASGVTVYEAYIKVNGEYKWLARPCIKDGDAEIYDFANGQISARTGTLTAGKKTKTVRTAQMVSFNADGAIKLNANCSSGKIVAAENRWMLCIPVEGGKTYSFLVDDTAKTNDWYFAEVSANTVEINTTYTNFTNRKGYSDATVTTAAGTKWIIMYPSLDLATAEAWYDSGITMVEGSTVPTQYIPYTIEVPLYELYGVGEPIVPDEYDVVEYIESNGTEYIDTGVVPTTNTIVETNIISNTTDMDIPVFGCKGGQASNSTYYHLTPFNNMWYYGKNDAESHAGRYTSAVGLSYNIKFNFDKSIIINGDTIATRINTTGNGNLLISGRIGTSSRIGKWKYKTFKIIEDTTLIRDYIPVKKKSNNEYGAYDLVTKQFFGNAGTGAFTGGNVVKNYAVDVLLGSQGVVDLGSLNWNKYQDDNTYYTIVADKAFGSDVAVVDGYSQFYGAVRDMRDKTITGASTSKAIYICDNRYTNAADFKAAMSGKYLYYQRTTDATFTPSKHTIYLPEQLHGVGDYQDTADFQTGAVARRVAKKVFDGTETLYDTGVLDSMWAWFTGYTDTSFNDRTVLSAHFKTASSLPPATDRTGYALLGKVTAAAPSRPVGKYVGLGIRDIAGTLEEAQAYLAAQYANGTPVTVYYPLATPTTTQLTGLPIISLTAKGEKSVENTNLVKGDVQVEYLGK